MNKRKTRMMVRGNTIIINKLGERSRAYVLYEVLKNHLNCPIELSKYSGDSEITLMIETDTYEHRMNLINEVEDLIKAYDGLTNKIRRDARF